METPTDPTGSQKKMVAGWTCRDKSINYPIFPLQPPTVASAGAPAVRFWQASDTLRLRRLKARVAPVSWNSL